MFSTFFHDPNFGKGLEKDYELGSDGMTYFQVPGSLSALPNLNGTAKPAAAPPASIAPQRVEAVPWCVNSGERLRFNNLFKQTDTDGDGFVSGVEIKNVFLQTGLPQNILAHIWWVPKSCCG